MKEKNKILLVLGIFLVLDGIVSVFWAMPDKCMNNSYLGNLIRILRTLIGFYLIYLGVNGIKSGGRKNDRR